MSKLLQKIQDIRYALWFIPAVMVLAAILLAVLGLHLDSIVEAEALARWPRLFGAGAEGSRSMVQAVASAMISVAALTFSITILVLSMAASQYTPRVLRTFMGSRATQTVLGAFVGIFVYCLVILRTIRGTDVTFVPSISVTIAMVLAIVGVGVLVYFIHHIASSIQASTVVSSVAKETIDMIDEAFPDCLDHDKAQEQPSVLPDYKWHPVKAGTTGYLRTIDVKALADYAGKHDAAVKFEKAIGEFVVEDTCIASLSKPADEAMQEELKELYTIGHHRTVEQDVMVGIRQLADIALKAMSPAVNDTTTALMSIDFLSAVLARLSNRRIAPASLQRDGKPVILTNGPEFNDYLCEAFDQIRRNAQGNTSIYIRVLSALTVIAEHTQDSVRKSQIADQVRLVWEYAQRETKQPDQVSAIAHHVSNAMASVSGRNS